MFVVWKYTPCARVASNAHSLFDLPSNSHIHASSECATTTGCTYTHSGSLQQWSPLCDTRARWLLFYDVLLIQRGAFTLCVGAPEILTHPCLPWCAMGDACGDETRGVCFLPAPCSVKYGRVTRRCRFALFVHGANVACKIEPSVILDDDAVRTGQMKNATRKRGKIHVFKLQGVILGISLAARGIKSGFDIFELAFIFYQIFGAINLIHRLSALKAFLWCL